MTTPQAAREYLNQHLRDTAGRDIAFYNPHDKPLDELPTIWGFNNGGNYGFMHAQLIAQDGMGLGNHLCSHEGYMRHDIGILEGSRPDRHEDFQKHYPDGYKMEFIPSEDVKTHEGLEEAYRLNKILAEEAEAKEKEEA